MANNTPIQSGGVKPQLPAFQASSVNFIQKALSTPGTFKPPVSTSQDAYVNSSPSLTAKAAEISDKPQVAAKQFSAGSMLGFGKSISAESAPVFNMPSFSIPTATKGLATQGAIKHSGANSGSQDKEP